MESTCRNQESNSKPLRLIKNNQFVLRVSYMQFFNIGFDDKNEAKKLGAKFNYDLKLWYAPNEAVAARLTSHFEPIGDQELVDLKAITELKELKGENRAFGGRRLFVDLVPASCWFRNVRSDIRESHWRGLSKFVITRAGGKCEVCGDAEDRAAGKFLDAHERWQYDYKTKTQKLIRIVCLCKPCHLYTHMGYAASQGREEEAIAHKLKVSGMTRQQVNEEINAAFTLWEKRNWHNWRLDLSILSDSGFKLLNQPDVRPNPSETSLAIQRPRMEARKSRTNKESQYQEYHTEPNNDVNDIAYKQWQVAKKFDLDPRLQKYVNTDLEI
jgi:hypothetical protein